MAFLYGDVLPMPALHNFADPVADEALAGVRCVTHPQELRVRRREAPRGPSEGPEEAPPTHERGHEDDTTRLTTTTRRRG